MRGLGPRWGAGALRTPTPTRRPAAHPRQECELVSLEAPLGCLGPVWAWDGGSGTLGSSLPESLPQASPRREKTQAQERQVPGRAGRRAGCRKV